MSFLDTLEENFSLFMKNGNYCQIYKTSKRELYVDPELTICTIPLDYYVEFLPRKLYTIDFESKKII
jgi:hypothetical protein